MRKAIKVYKGGLVKLPAGVRRDLQIEEGDELIVGVEGDKLVLVPKKAFDPVEALASELGASVNEDKLLEEGVKALKRVLGKALGKESR